MTTIFLLLAAVRDRAQELKMETLAPEIEQTLLKNMFKQGNDTYKVLPTQADREPFVLIMEGGPPNAESQIARPTGFSLSNFGTRQRCSWKRSSESL